MKVFLLILSLITGLETSGVKQCSGGWFEFTCKYPKNYNLFSIKTNKKQSISGNEWGNSDRRFLYNDTKNQNVRVILKDLKHEDSGTYRCEFKQSELPEPEVVNIIVEGKACNEPPVQTVHNGAETTVRCEYSEQFKSKVKFICKENSFTCEEIQSTPPSHNSRGTFPLTNTTAGFAVSIGDVSSHHAGVYWCGVKEKDGGYRAGLTKIELKVKDIRNFTKLSNTGQDVKFFCKFEENVKDLTKFFCKGEEPASCQLLANTNTETNPRFSMKETTRLVTVTIRGVTAADSGSYWCGAENSDEQRRKIFTHRMSLSVGDTAGLNYVIIQGCLLMLGLLVILVPALIIYKRNLCSRNTEAAAEQQLKQDSVYEEIPNQVQTPVNNVYATANFPANSPASLHYSTISFHSSPADRSDGDVLFLTTSSASCQYSVLSSCQNSDLLADQPSGSADQPVYSTVLKPQRK